MGKSTLTYKNALFIMFSVFMCSFLSAQEKRWSEQNLTWNDYKKVIQQSGIHHAFTYSGISFEMYAEKDTVQIKVYSYFDPSQSWVHPDHKVPALLNHEQLHFDITELYARKMKKEMSKYYFLSVSEFVSKKIDTEVKSIFTSLYNEHMSIQQKYDVETQHGILSDEQFSWQKSIEEQLQELSTYSTGYSTQVGFKK
jgi:hypothetical protein